MDIRGLIVPPARSEGLLIRSLRGEILVYDVQTQATHCLDPAAARVWHACDGRATVGDLVDRLEPDLPSPIDVAWIWQTLQELDSHRLFEAPLPLPDDAAGLSRRKFLQTLGKTAVALPVIITYIPPKPSPVPVPGGRSAPFASCVGNGGPCTSQSDCCPGLNCIGNPKHCG
jgi:hypothetical protein